ncbi:MAG TPA: hypothetical protein VGK89_01215 [Candidatus Eisenbacteria bacterium]|jgi:hypothetical protein
MILADSLRHVIAHKDSLLEAAATHAIHVSVPPQHVTVTPSRDWFDWLQLLATLVISTAAAILAAIWGARIGGREARRATLAAMREEARLDQESKRNQLVQRLRYVLPRIRGMGRSLGKQDPEHPILRDVLEEVVLMWEAYDRLSDYGTYLDTPEFVARVRTFLAEAATTAKLGIADEDRDLSMKLAGHPAFTGPQANRGTVMRRQQTITRISAWASEGDNLIRELDRLVSHSQPSTL